MRLMPMQCLPPKSSNPLKWLAFAAPRTDISAWLNFYVNPEGEAPLEYRFEYSTDGANWIPLEDAVSETEARKQIVVAEKVSGLAPGTTYFYRLGFVKNEAGSVTGLAGSRSFTTWLCRHLVKRARRARLDRHLPARRRAGNPTSPWGIPVRTPPGLNRASIVSRTTAPRCPQVYRRHSRWLTMREWRAFGVAPVGRSLPENEMASLIEPDGPELHRLSADHQLSLDPRLQLLEFLRDFGRGSGERDCAAITGLSPLNPGS